MKPCIVIPVHNRRELTLSCVRHLFALGEEARHEILIIDDGSTDGTAAAVAREFPSVQIVRGSGQLWWTGAIALGMERAFQAGAGAVVWLNDDCLPDPDTLGRMAAGAAALEVVAPVCLDARTGAPVPNAFRGREVLRGPPGNAQEVDGLSGFCVHVPRAVWERIGTPDAARFPHYYGDTAYTLRAKQAGCAIRLRGDAIARLVDYAPRAETIGDFMRRAPGGREWIETFRSPRSPFHLKAQRHYLQLRYGRAGGFALWLARAAGWQLAWVVARRAAPHQSRRN